jgi:hypothetical protein
VRNQPDAITAHSRKEEEAMTTTASKEDLLRITFSTPQKQITRKEQQRRKELAAGIETLIAHFESMFRTDVDGIEMYPCDCKDCVEL